MTAMGVFLTQCPFQVRLSNQGALTDKLQAKTLYGSALCDPFLSMDSARLLRTCGMLGGASWML